MSPLPHTPRPSPSYPSHGVRALLAIALPIIASQAADTIMVFTDRYFLAHLSPAHMSAAMLGGLTSFFCTTLFFGITSYVTAIVAQHYGAGKHKACSLAVTQAVILSCIAYPFLLATIPVASWAFDNIGHDPVQVDLEKTYYGILTIGTLASLIRVTLSGFFSGLGKTGIVLTSNVIGTLANIPLSYMLIFGKGGLPELGVAGAAIGTVLGSAITLIVLAWAYWRRDNRETFFVHRSFRFDKAMAKKFLTYGFPSGMEFFLKMGAIILFFQLFHTYGPTAAASLSITIQWDFVAFLPIIGLHIGIMSLVGQHMGRGDVQGAHKVARSGLILACSYAALMIILFVGFTELLVGVFTPKSTGIDYDPITTMATTQLRIAALYTLANATYQVFSGILKGAGDTRWSMIATLSAYGLLAIASVITIPILNISPIHAWWIFVATVIALSIGFAFRFWSGKWQRIKMVKS